LEYTQHLEEEWTSMSCIDCFLLHELMQQVLLSLHLYTGKPTRFKYKWLHSENNTKLIRFISAQYSLLYSHTLHWRAL